MSFPMKNANRATHIPNKTLLQISSTKNLTMNWNKNRNTQLEHQQEQEQEHQHPVLKMRGLFLITLASVCAVLAIQELAKPRTVYPRPTRMGTGLSWHPRLVLHQPASAGWLTPSGRGPVLHSTADGFCVTT